MVLWCTPVAGAGNWPATVSGPPPIVVDPSGTSPPTTPLEKGGGPISVFLVPALTGPSAKSTGEEAVGPKDTMPILSPAPERVNCTKSEAASRAPSIFLPPVPASLDMLAGPASTLPTTRLVGRGRVGA